MKSRSDSFQADVANADSPSSPEAARRRSVLASDLRGHAAQQKSSGLALSRAFAGMLAAAGLLLSVAPAATAAGWKIVPSPSTGTINQLNAAAVSGSDAWAVGTTGLPDFNSEGVILHWNGRSWQRIRHPNPSGAVFVNLLGVTAASASDAWAVGRWGDANLGVHPLALHWNGSAWQLVNTPVLSGGDTFQAVKAIAADDVWAVGRTRSR